MVIKNFRFSIGGQILIGTIFIVFIFSGVNLFNYFQSQNMQQGYDRLLDVTPVINDVKDIHTELWLQNAGVRGYVLSGDTKYLQDIEASRKRVDSIYERLEKMLIDKDGQKSSRLLKVMLNEYNKQQDNTIATRNKLGFEQAAKFVSATGERADIIGTVLQSFTDSVTNDVNNQVTQNKKKLAQGQQVVLLVNIIGLILALAGGIGLTYRIARPIGILANEARQVASGDLRRQTQKYSGSDEIADLLQAFEGMVGSLRTMVDHLRGTADHVAVSGEQLKAHSDQSAQAASSIAETVMDVANGASKQMAAIEAAATIIQDMANAITHIAESAANVSAKSGEAATMAIMGGQAVSDAERQMEAINQSVMQSKAVVSNLGDSSKEIGEIVDVIRNIAGQTNLLALNAAIEAARAGEAGRGFSVVADEVRGLAEQSQVAAQRISEIVNNVQTEAAAAILTMNDGVAEVTQGTQAIINSGNHFKNIDKVVQNLNDKIMEISSATQQLAASSNAVVNSVEHIKTIATETAAGAQHISAATEEQSASMQQIAIASETMADTANRLREAVNQFKI